MERLIVTLETSIQRLRTLIIALTPPDLSKGLGMALRKLAEGIFLGTPTEITVLGEAHVHLTALSKGNAHRILREAMVNARKHAHAEHVVLELSERDGTVVARLTDDGVGAAQPRRRSRVTWGWPPCGPGPTPTGVVLTSISAPGKGTTILLTLPMAPAGKCEHHGTPNSALLGIRRSSRGNDHLARSALMTSTGPVPVHSENEPGSWVCTIVICDDQPELRAAIVDILASNPQFLVVGSCGRRHHLPGAGAGNRSRLADPGRQHARRWAARREGSEGHPAPTAHCRVFRPGGRQDRTSHARSGSRPVRAQDGTDPPSAARVAIGVPETGREKILI